jgi:hypothetical protein
MVSFDTSALSICPPAAVYAVYALTQVAAKIFRTEYTEALIELTASSLFVVLLNYLCSIGRSTLAWLIIFVPFVFMSVLIGLLIFLFGHDASAGRIFTDPDERAKAPEDVDPRETERPSGEWAAAAEHDAARRDAHMQKREQLRYTDFSQKGHTHTANDLWGEGADDVVAWIRAKYEADRAAADVSGSTTASASSNTSSGATQDTTQPFIRSVTIASDSSTGNPSLATVGNIVTITVVASEPVTISRLHLFDASGHRVTTTNSASGNTATARFTVTKDTAVGALILGALAVRDAAGNEVGQTETTDGSSVTVVAPPDDDSTDGSGGGGSSGDTFVTYLHSALSRVFR